MPKENEFPIKARNANCCMEYLFNLDVGYIVKTPEVQRTACFNVVQGLFQAGDFRVFNAWEETTRHDFRGNLPYGCGYEGSMYPGFTLLCENKSECLNLHEMPYMSAGNAQEMTRLILLSWFEAMYRCLLVPERQQDEKFLREHVVAFYGMVDHEKKYLSFRPLVVPRTEVNDKRFDVTQRDFSIADVTAARNPRRKCTYIGEMVDSEVGSRLCLNAVSCDTHREK